MGRTSGPVPVRERPVRTVGIDLPRLEVGHAPRASNWYVRCSRGSSLMTLDGAGACTSSSKSSSMAVARFEKTVLKLHPVRVTVAPSGALVRGLRAPALPP